MSFFLKATDQGTPVQSTDATVRIDTFTASLYVVRIYFSMKETDFVYQLTAIKSALQNTTALKTSYPNSKVGFWKLEMSR